MKDCTSFTEYNIKLSFDEKEEKEENKIIELEYLSLAAVYLEPEVEEISIFGEVTILWNEDILRVGNDTYFEE